MQSDLSDFTSTLPRRLRVKWAAFWLLFLVSVIVNTFYNLSIFFPCPCDWFIVLYDC